MTPRLVLILGWLLPALARADAIGFQLQNKVLSGGKDRPGLVVEANEPVDNVEVKLKREDGKTFTWSSGRMKPGARKQMLLDVPAGEHHFNGTLAVLLGKDRQSLELDFDAEVIKPAVLTVDKSRVNLEKRKLEVTSSRKTSKVEVTVQGDQGETLGESTVTFDKAPPGTPLEVSWRQSEGRVLKIGVKVYDPDNFYSGVDLFPWSVQIPHEEVNFASGSFKIEKTEEPKLERSLTLIGEAVDKYGRWADIKLYVGGHTDTVGPTDMNRGLSLNRARAISEYFRRRGLRIPIYYEGFGEEALLVPTADETDEVKNRRAEYIVAIEEPPILNTKFAPTWKPLK